MFKPGDRVQFPKENIISSTGSIDDLSGMVLGTIEDVISGRVCAILPDKAPEIYVYVLMQNLFPFPLSA